ncbi:choice-of-anchor M domain-containing protein [Microbacterium sp. BWT-B31]|uniref:choice-of-anchor M domain-containing protein n=1 Tax=Microbacterium sp. BWT-B31 TaxID=3232072 RepID=UPI0035299E9C
MPRTALSRLARRSGLILAAALLAAQGVLPAAASVDDDLDQVIDSNQQQGTGQVVLSAGHADFGPTFGTGRWALQIHDDTSVPRYWRNPEDVVLQVTDAATLTVPEDEAFAFLQLPAGAPVHVIPQTEQPGVIWAGWNTQEPTLLGSLSLGATLRVHAVEGPGDVVVYLQGGNFGAPQPLWSTHEPFPQDAWIEVNTHTHANWVFSRPGVYLVDAEFTGDLVTGETMTARGTLRFAVGDATDPADAFAAHLSRSPEGDSAQTAAAPASGDESAAGADASDSAVWYLVAGGAAVLVIAVLVVGIATTLARRRGRGDAGTHGDAR